MKKILTALLFVATATPTLAHHGGAHHGHHVRPGHHNHHFQHHRHHHYRHHNWVAPLIIGGVATYALTRPDPVIIRDQPVIIEQPVDVIPGTNCSPWRELQQPDGSVVRERTCYTR